MRMAFLKRIEVWVLIFIGGGAGLWVLFDKPVIEGDPLPIEVGEASEGAAALVIHRCTLERDYSNARLDIELRYQNTSPRPLVLQPPDVRLLTAEGQEVPPFILPMEKPPQIPAQTAQSVRLRFWLESAHLKKALSLEVRGSTAEVKSATPLELDKLENQKTKSWQGSIR
jgi:hypothetical protein